MDLAEFREYWLTKPGASEATPFGPDALVFKVGGKMFALAALDEVPPTVNLKCDPDLALEPAEPVRASQAWLSHEQETLEHR
jgi:predicted DNA-binding protein (MmcQ/YjbR family)